MTKPHIVSLVAEPTAPAMTELRTVPYAPDPESPAPDAATVAAAKVRRDERRLGRDRAGLEWLDRRFHAVHPDAACPISHKRGDDAA